MQDSELRDALRLPDGNLGPIAKVRRADAISEAQAWPSGQDLGHQRYVQVSPNCGEYCVMLGKPGKEAAPGYAKPNAHDMTPTIFRNGAAIPWTPTFDELFRQFQHMGAAEFASERLPGTVLELLACLLFRSAFMLDHKEQGLGSRIWRYEAPESVVAAIEDQTPMMMAGLYELPFRVFLELIDALAWNEDVKYNPDPMAVQATGRRNTMLTCVNIIGVFLDRVSLVDFVTLMLRGRGVAPISAKAAKLYFPLLEP